eukprot:4505023-Prymnesium_polylepis.1
MPPPHQLAPAPSRARSPRAPAVDVAGVRRCTVAPQVRLLHPHQLDQLHHRRPNLRAEVGPRATPVAVVNLQGAH